MSFTTTLGAALQAASRVIIAGYEIEEFDYSQEGIVKLAYCDEQEFRRYFDTEIEIEISDGQALVPECVEDGSDEEPGMYCFEFRVERFMQERDL